MNNELIPLERATLCLDCHQISVSGASCIGCGSYALVNIARWLDRRPVQPSKRARHSCPVCGDNCECVGAVEIRPGRSAALPNQCSHLCSVPAFGYYRRSQ